VASEKRRQRRDFCSSHVLYSHWNNGNGSTGVYSARCSDVGPVGMCIYTSYELEPGSFLKITKPNGTLLERVAAVRWVDRLDVKLFRAGLTFLKK